MIKSFLDPKVETFFYNGGLLPFPGLDPVLTMRKLDLIDNVHAPEDFCYPRLNDCRVDEADPDKYSIALGDGWRLFFLFKNGNAANVYIKRQ